MTGLMNENDIVIFDGFTYLLPLTIRKKTDNINISTFGLPQKVHNIHSFV